jgi:hypothetical protein
MQTKFSPTELSARIQKLLEERQQHADALSLIDQTLAGVSVALSGAPAAPPNGKAVTTVAAPASRTIGKRRRGRGHFALSAEESVLAFVKRAKNPTTAEISKHLLGEGRSNGAINALTKLVKEKRLKRKPIEGERGSRYSVH